MNVQTVNFDKSGLYRCAYKENLSVREHIHQCTEIVYLLEGEAYIRVGNEERTMKPGDLAVISPFISHFFESSDNINAWLCVFSNDFLRDFLPHGEMYRPRSSAFFRISDRLSEYLKDRLPDSDEEMVQFNYADRRKLMNVIFPIYNEWLDATCDTNTADTKSSLLSNILLYLDEHYSEPLTIQDVSRALGYTPRHISRQLSMLKEYNFRSLLNSFRVEHSKLSMRTSDAKLIDIAISCGFTSERTFFRAFLDSERITPNEYRKMLRL